MLNENIVSLLIPCYNGEQFVERCLINVLEQEYAQYIELILVNDGSTDKTEEIIFQLQKRLDNELWRFCYIKQENQGVGSAMNAALKEVSGEYLTSLDIDDLMTKDCISKKVSWLKANPSYALVRSNGYFLFPNQEKRLFYAEDYKASEDVFLGYKIRWYNEGIYICEYQDIGLTKGNWDLLRKNKMGYAMLSNMQMITNEEFKEKFKAAGQHIALSIVAGYPSYIFKTNKKWLTVLALPYGILLSFRRREQFKWDDPINKRNYI